MHMGLDGSWSFSFSQQIHPCEMERNSSRACDYTDWMDHGNILPFFLENSSMRNAEKFMRNGAKTCEL